MKKYKNKICKLLLSTRRDGIEDLISNLDELGFFESPASTKYHGCYVGGLAEHSYKVFKKLTTLTKSCRICIPKDEIIIASILHDICKAGAYSGTQRPYEHVATHPRGHAVLSLERISKFIVLTEKERNMIKYHMGIFATTDFNPKNGEFSAKELGDMQNKNYIITLMHMADNLVALEEMSKNPQH